MSLDVTKLYGDYRNFENLSKEIHRSGKLRDRQNKKDAFSSTSTLLQSLSLIKLKEFKLEIISRCLTEMVNKKDLLMMYSILELPEQICFYIDNPERHYWVPASSFDSIKSDEELYACIKYNSTEIDELKGFELYMETQDANSECCEFITKSFERFIVKTLLNDFISVFVSNGKYIGTTLAINDDYTFTDEGYELFYEKISDIEKSV